MRGIARRYRSFVLGLLAVGSLALSACGTQASAQAPTSGEVYTLNAACPPAQQNCDVAKEISTTEQVLLRRVSGGLGFTFSSIKQSGPTTLQLTIPGANDSGALQSLLTVEGNVAFLDTKDQQLPVGTTVRAGQYSLVMTGDQIDPRTIQAEVDPVEQLPVVNFMFQGQARKQFATYTNAHLNQYLTVTMDNKVIDSVQIQSQILNTAQLSDVGDLQAAKVLAAELQGALPLAVTVAGEHHYSATPTATAKGA